MSPRRSADIYATVFALGLAVFLLLGYALRPLIGGEGVPAKIARVADRASVDNGRAVARELISDGAASFLWSAHWLGVAALVVVVLCGAGLARNFLRGDFFTLGSYRWVSAMCWALIFYMFVPGFVGMLGGNMVLRDLNLHWMSIPAIDTQVPRDGSEGHDAVARRRGHPPRQRLGVTRRAWSDGPRQLPGADGHRVRCHLDRLLEERG